MSNLKKRIYTSLILVLLFIFIFSSKIILTFSLLSFGVLSFIEFSIITKKILKKNKLKILFFNTLFFIYIFIFSYLFFYLSNFIQLKFILFLLLIGCIASDIGGFVFGKILKGPKLTKISPNKTFSGAIGSIILTCVAINLIVLFFLKTYDYKFILISVVTSIFCQLGDLFFSFLKRRAKIQDTGSFLPGHGGVLDRLDGIYLGLPVGFVFTFLYLL